MLSKLTIVFIALLLLAVRIAYIDWDAELPVNVLTWDAFGYYLYLPGQYIYGDITKLAWLPPILEQYHPTGSLYQTIALPNGNFAMKYLMGLSILYTPFFFLGHWAAGWLGYKQDGFSAPYQLAICAGAWVYACVGFWLLRKVLLRFFDDTTTAITLALVGLATNYLQYVSVDTAQTHGFLFTVYAALLWAIIRWHEQPTLRGSLWLGWLIGVSCITRPTEGVMLFLATLWVMPLPDGMPSKWAFFKSQPRLLYAALAGGFVGMLPQLVYWKIVTGKWVFDVGSKFLFFRPHWQVLFGWNKGWFVYTPVTILMILGLFLMRKYPFRKAVLTFTLLNIWIIIAWSDWRYGATYSSRAMVQSYPVLALPLALVVQWLIGHEAKPRTSVGHEAKPRISHVTRRSIAPASLLFFAALIGINLFQIWQYNRTILHYYDMNRAYYAAIFLNPNPTPFQMSLLDTPELIRDEAGWSEKGRLVQADSVVSLRQNKFVFLEKALSDLPDWKPEQDNWLRITAQVKSANGAFNAHLVASVVTGETTKRTACRLENGICKKGEWNDIAFDFQLVKDGKLVIEAVSENGEVIELKNVVVRWVARVEPAR